MNNDPSFKAHAPPNCIAGRLSDTLSKDGMIHTPRELVRDELFRDELFRDESLYSDTLRVEEPGTKNYHSFYLGIDIFC